MPEAGGTHVLDLAGLAVSQFNFDFVFLLAGAGLIAALLALILGLRLFQTDTRALATDLAWLGRCFLAGAGRGAAALTYLGWQGLTIPLGVTKVVMGFYKVMQGEVILTITQPGASADDLFEFDHRVNRTHQHDIAHIAGIYAG